MFEPQDLLDVQSVLTRTPGDFVYQHRDLRHWRIHPVEQAKCEWQRNLREALRPIGLDLAAFDLLRASHNFSQPLAFNCRRYSVVLRSHAFTAYRFETQIRN